jgi:hypothetical protein
VSCYDSEVHFVVSAPRSGSTWLARALNQHPDIFATEQRLFGNFCEIWPNNNGSKSPRMTFDAYAQALAVHYFFEQWDMNRTAFVKSFQTAYFEFLKQFASQHSRKRILVDKITPYAGTANYVFTQIENYFPDSKRIGLIRDGRDVLTSGAFDWLMKDAEGTPRHKYYVQSQPRDTLHRLFDDELVAKWSTHWAEICRVFDRSFFHLNVSFEAMIDDQAQELRRIFRTLNVDDSPEIARRAAEATTFARTTGRNPGDHRPTEKARKGIVGDWKNYFTRIDGKLFDEVAGHWLIRYGYEANQDWISFLPDDLSEKNLT